MYSQNDRIKSKILLYEKLDLLKLFSYQGLSAEKIAKKLEEMKIFDAINKPFTTHMISSVCSKEGIKRRIKTKKRKTNGTN